MLTQTLAIFLDAYRELNAKRMFWIVLVLSSVVVLAFAAVGIQGGELTLVGKHLSVPVPMDPPQFYRFLFTSLGIGVWLTFIATILALISTSSIFPDFVSGGSIDLYLSKPISRLRLFLTKYIAGLLFAALQVLVFSAASFFVIGIRGGSWEPRLFLAVPIVVCFFSYLFCVSVLVGVVTRSTVAAILLTILAWGVMSTIASGEVGILVLKTGADREAKAAEPTLKLVNAQIAGIEKRSAEERAESAGQLEHLRAQRADLELQVSSTARRNLGIAHTILYRVKTVLPKTGDTIDLLGRWLLSPETMETGGDGLEDEDAPPAASPASRPRARHHGGPRKIDALQVQKTVNTRPLSWVIGTSLGFEAVVLVLAAWVFVRRDY